MKSADLEATFGAASSITQFLDRRFDYLLDERFSKLTHFGMDGNGSSQRTAAGLNHELVFVLDDLRGPANRLEHFQCTLHAALQINILSGRRSCRHRTTHFTKSL